MDYPSPVLNRSRPHYQNSGVCHSGSGFDCPSPDFIPFNYSSPRKIGNAKNFRGGHRRYFSGSNGSFNSASSFSPYNNRQRNSRGSYNRNSFGMSCSNSSVYYDPSMLEDPWAELERELDRKMQASINCGSLPEPEVVA